MTSLIRIEKVNKDSNAEKSGLLVNDFILQVNKVEIKNYEHFKEVWRNCDTKNVNVFLVRRKNDEIEIKIHMKESTVLGIATVPIEVNNNSKDKIKNKTKTKEINLEEAIELINKNKSVFNEDIIQELHAFYEINGGIIELHAGNVSLEDLLIGNDICIVNGNLIVENTIEDCDEVDSSLLIILGDVKCKNLITMSSIFITGDLSVDNVILGDSLCDYILSVGGNIKTETILDYGHCIISNKKIKAQNIFSFNSIEDENGVVEANLTRENLVDKIIEIDNDERIEQLGETIDFIKNGGTKFHK